MNDNKLIAEFMGAIFDDNGMTRICDKGGRVSDLNLLFHTSWDWLMPVVQKIESLGYVFTIQGGKAEFGEMACEPQCFIVNDKLSSTYKAVVKFIKEFN